MDRASYPQTISRELFLDSILQSAVDYAIISIDLDGNITSWNEGALRTLGWTAEEIIGQPVTQIFTDEDNKVGIASREMSQALTHESANDERWHRRKDGTKFWASGRMTALRTPETSVVGFLKILRDRSDYRTSDDRQRVLMNELSHRLKNTLAVVQSITSYSLRHANSLEEAADSITARLQAYATAHDILLQRDWRTATLASLIKATGRNIGLAGSSRIAMRGPPVELGPQAALTLALVLHELATNAVKYGALSNSVGTISVLWSLTESREGGSRLEFSWIERGGPRLTGKGHEGFGTRLIKSSLGSLGHASCHFEPEGFALNFSADYSVLQGNTASAGGL